MIKKVIVVLVTMSFLYSCKKDYMCECTNSSGPYDAGEITNTKRKAKKQCEALSTANTTCTLK